MAETRESVDPAARTRRGHNWHPPRAASRAWSSPSFERTLPSRESTTVPSGETGKAFPSHSCSPLPSTRPSTGSSVSKRSRPPWSPGATLPERSDKSVERFKDDCWRLKQEVADRREETRQLQQRVRLLEGSLQVRMNHVETLVEELRNTPGLTDGIVAGNRRVPELLDQIIQEARRTQVVLHVHADNGLHMEAKDRLLEQAQQDRQKQDILEEKLADSRLETRRLAAKVREGEQSSLRQRLEQVRRSARKQDELLAEYECSHRDLNVRVQLLMAELEEERQSRREQELNVQRLTAMLTEALPPRSPPPAALSAPAGGAAEEPEMASPASMSRTLALRLEHERLCDEERAQRRLRRRMQVRQQPGTYRQGVSEAQRDEAGADGSANPSAATASTAAADHGRDDDGDRGTSDAAAAARALGSALARAEDACCAEAAAERAAAEACAQSETLRMESAALRDELQEARAEAARAVASVVELEDAREHWTAQVHRELQQHAAMAEKRSWALAEVANEVVLQADLRQLRMLQDEVHMQKAMGAAELRCAMLADIVNQAAGGSCSESSTLNATR